MTRQDLPSPELLRKLLRYEPETGKLFWKERSVDMFTDGAHTAAHKCARWNSRYAEANAFMAGSSEGYRTSTIFGRTMKAHRVSWAIYYGEWPAEQIDHINGDKTNNRIANLRAVSHRENGLNQRHRCNNASGVMGVCWDNQTEKWRAYIHGGKRRKNIGRFSDKADAIAARKAAEIELGYHANHGRKK